MGLLGCCHTNSAEERPVTDLEEERLRAASHAPDNDILETEFHIPGMHCIACVRRIERALAGLDYVVDARANLSNRKVRIKWRQRDGQARDLSRAIDREGFEHAVLQIGEVARDPGAETQRQLLAQRGFVFNDEYTHARLPPAGRRPGRQPLSRCCVDRDTAHPAIFGKNLDDVDPPAVAGHRFCRQDAPTALAHSIHRRVQAHPSPLSTSTG